MQNISKELKEAFLTDSKHKTLTLRHPVTDFSKVNFWTENLSGPDEIYNVSFSGAIHLAKEIASVPNDKLEPMLKYSAYAEYVVVSYAIRIQDWISDITPGYIRPYAVCKISGGITSRIGSVISFSEVSNGFVNVKISFTQNQLRGSGAVMLAISFELLDSSKHTYPSGAGVASFNVEYKDLQINMGTAISEMPYSDTYQPALYGYDFEHYILATYPRNNGSVITNSAIIKESASFYENISPEENFTYGGCTSVAFNVNLMNDNSFAVNDYIQASIKIDDVDEEVPLGIFKIYDTETSGSHNLIEKRIEAYDDMICLNKDATNWWSNYVYAVDTSDSTKEGYECTRQMFSTLYNALESAGINFKSAFEPTQTVKTDEDRGVSSKFYFNPENEDEYIEYKLLLFSFTERGKYYRINVKGQTDYMPQIKELLEDYMTQQNGTKRYDDPKNSPAGNIIILTLDKQKMILVNDGDIFKWEEEYGFFAFVPYRYVFKYNEQTISETLSIDYDEIEATQYDFNLFDTANDDIRLVYYNWETKEISNPSSVTFRDVARSLIELTGGFLRYGRGGLLEWIRPQTEFLYPSLTRYPSESLYPIKGPSAQIDNSQIRSYKKKGIDGGLYGGIDIIAGLNSLGENNVALSYTEDESKPNRYVIDENVFYAQDGVNYAKTFSGIDVVPEATQMLENLYSMIQGFSFAPYEAKVRGMPWIESGDRIMIKTGEGYFGSFIYERYLSGIQLLVDDYETTAEN